MLVSTLFFALITALVVYLEYEYIKSLVIYKFEVEPVMPLFKDIFNPNPTTATMDEIPDPTVINWVPLTVDYNETIYNEVTYDNNVDTAFVGLCMAIAGAALGGILLMNHYCRRQPRQRQRRNVPPPSPSSPRLPPNQQLQQPENRPYWELFARLQQHQQREFDEIIENIEQFPHRPRHRPRRIPLHRPSLRLRSLSYSPPPPPYRRVPPPLMPPPPPYSPPPAYSRIDRNPPD